MSNSYVAVSLSGGKDSTAMKPTDEERRETAEKLRNMCSYGCRYAEQFYELLKETVMDSWDFHEFGDVAERLADLIEPAPERTCRNDSTKRGKGVFLCSECSIHLDMAEMDEENLDAFYEQNFCPNCGALVEGADR